MCRFLDHFQFAYLDLEDVSGICMPSFKLSVFLFASYAA